MTDTVSMLNNIENPQVHKTKHHKKSSTSKDDPTLNAKMTKLTLEQDSKIVIICRNKPTPKAKSHKPAINQETFYPRQENIKLIKEYGSDMYNFSQILDKDNGLHESFLDRHPLSPDVRTRMVDWMVEVFYAYKCEPQTFFLAVDIMDRYIATTTKKVKDDDIHLLGVVCIFIASKMEDIAPLRMVHIVQTISHNKFKAEQIEKKERDILSTIDFKVVSVSTYDFVMTFISDLEINNAEKIEELHLKKYLKSYKETCIFLAKLMTLDDKFSCIFAALKATAAVIVAFDIIRSVSKTFTGDMETFFEQWLSFLADSSDFDNELITTTYNKLSGLYKNVESAKKSGVDEFSLSNSIDIDYY